MEKPTFTLNIENLVGKIVILNNPSAMDVENHAFINDLKQSEEIIEATLKSTLKGISNGIEPDHEQNNLQDFKEEPLETEFIEESLSGAVCEMLQSDEAVRSEVRKIVSDALGAVVFKNSQN